MNDIYLFLVLLCMIFPIPIIGEMRTQICPQYHAKRTNNGKDHFCLCTFLLCPGEFVSVDGCYIAKGPQVLYLLNNQGAVINSSLQYSSHCNGAAQIINARPTLKKSKCSEFKIKEGCKGMKSCRGEVRIHISDSPIPSTPDNSNLVSNNISESKVTHFSYLRQESNFSAIKFFPINTAPKEQDIRDDAGGDATFGYCSTGKEISVIEILLVSLAAFFGFIICGLGIIPFLCALLESCLCPAPRNGRSLGFLRSRGTRTHTPPVTELSDDEEVYCR